MPRAVFICIFKLQGTEFSQFSVVRYDAKSHHWHGYQLHKLIQQYLISVLSPSFKHLTVPEKSLHSATESTLTERFCNIVDTVNALTAVGALRALIDYTLSNARRSYSTMGNPLAVKGLTPSKTSPLKP